MPLSPEEKKRRAQKSIENIRLAYEEAKGEEASKRRKDAQKQEEQNRENRKERKKARNEKRKHKTCCNNKFCECSAE